MRTLTLCFRWFGGVRLSAKAVVVAAVALTFGTAQVALAALAGLILAVPHGAEAAGCTAPSLGAATT